MNPTVILALISDLYNQIAMLSERSAQLESALSESSGTIVQLTADKQRLESELEDAREGGEEALEAVAQQIEEGNAEG